MKNITFNWDSLKALSNQKKHGVSFEEAKSAFYDEVINDPEHSEDEERFILLGAKYKDKIIGGLSLLPSTR